MQKVSGIAGIVLEPTPRYLKHLISSGRLYLFQQARGLEGAHKVTAPGRFEMNMPFGCPKGLAAGGYKPVADFIDLLLGQEGQCLSDFGPQGVAQDHQETWGQGVADRSGALLVVAQQPRREEFL